jgi:hypothetical protein
MARGIRKLFRKFLTPDTMSSFGITTKTRYGGRSDAEKANALAKAEEKRKMRCEKRIKGIKGA